MTMEELVGELMKHADEYAIKSEENILVDTEPVRKHKKKRIQKKWLKRFGVKPIYQKKKCKKIEVTVDLIAEFCHQYGYPLPDEIMDMMETNKGEK